MRDLTIQDELTEFMLYTTPNGKVKAEMESPRNGWPSCLGCSGPQ